MKEIPTASILKRLQIEALNDMQELALQSIPQEKNTVLLAPTGSGKTLAFLLPVLQLMDIDRPGVQCLVISPTRELAIQIERVWQQMGTGLKVVTCYGGHDMQTEVRSLSQPPALLIGTPGRLTEHLSRESFDAANVHFLILDEYDKSLTLGFKEQIDAITDALPHLKKRILVSATKLSTQEYQSAMDSSAGSLVMGAKILDFTQEEDKSTDGLIVKRVLFGASASAKANTAFQPNAETRRINLLGELLCNLGLEQSLVFCNQRDTTEWVTDQLANQGLRAHFFHGGMEQQDREKTLIQFRNGSITTLVTSDLLARGMDIPDVRHIIHYEMPHKEADFVHRNGRTARMYNTGAAYVLVADHPFIPADAQEFVLEDDYEPVAPAPWITIYISGGKKEKLSKGDILGFFTKIGQLEADQIGKMEVLDHMSFVAVRRDIHLALLKRIEGQKMKGKKYKIEPVRS